MNAGQQEKPGTEEWLHWARVIVDRLTACVHVYKHNLDVFMPTLERQEKTGLVIRLLQRVYPLLDQGESLEDDSAASADEKIISDLGPLFKETIKALTWLSADMQKLLQSPWMSKFPSKMAEIMFAGNGNEFEGIGSGYAEQGRLPAALTELLERETEGDVRPLRGSSPKRHDMESHDRWVEQNTKFMRTAGRVE